ncbi:N-acetylmuramidase family protein [Pseudomonas sp. PWP3-1b2]|uniref:N-acetylmuramidase family protein n=1 Tax=Pseudomonas sp. PWP3-1b2 TaxID=2804656 RepID=UPI003CF39693
MTSLQGLPISIKASVGTPGKAVNDPADVRSIQHLFNLIKSTSDLPLVEDGKSGPKLVQRISAYQVARLKAKNPDGVIDANGQTFKSLVEDAGKATPSVQAPVQPEKDRQQWLTEVTCDGGVTLTEADFKNAAAQLGNGISVNLIKAFATVESGGRSGFGPAKLPVIAFEGHTFRKYTGNSYDKSHPLLSYPYLVKAGPQWRANNRDQATAWRTLADAFKLDPQAALKSASYGMFQIMGFNFAACGYKNVTDFVVAMKLNAGNHLKAFVGFCSKTPPLIKAMRNKDYVGMASNYNGDDYGDYDKRIKKAYEALEQKK